MDRLQDSDNEAAAVAVAPRVSLADIEAEIAFETTFTVHEAIDTLNTTHGPIHPEPMPAHKTLTLCVVTTVGGFTVIGKSAPADPQNFDAPLGKKFAREDAIRQLWPLMGFALSQKLAGRI